MNLTASEMRLSGWPFLSEALAAGGRLGRRLGGWPVPLWVPWPTAEGDFLDLFVVPVRPEMGLAPGEAIRMLRGLGRRLSRLRPTGCLWVPVAGPGRLMGAAIREGLWGTGVPAAVAGWTERPDPAAFPWPPPRPVQPPPPPPADRLPRGVPERLPPAVWAALGVAARPYPRRDPEAEAALAAWGLWAEGRPTRAARILFGRLAGLPVRRADRRIWWPRRRPDGSAHRRVLETLAERLRAGWPEATWWGIWREPLAPVRGRPWFPDGMAWGRMPDGAEAFVFVEVESGHRSHRQLAAGLRRLLERAVRATPAGGRAVALVLGPPWVVRSLRSFPGPIPPGAAVVLAPWRGGGRWPAPAPGGIRAAEADPIGRRGSGASGDLPGSGPFGGGGGLGDVGRPALSGAV